MRTTRRILVTAACVWAVAAPGAWADHSTDRRDCSDFLTQAGAREYFAQHRGDPDRLDPDNDGMPCEELPAGVQGSPGGGTSATTATTAANGTTTTSDKLVRTGSEDGLLTAVAALLMTAGAALVAVAKGRRRTT
jgi:hypothetical protein